MSAPVTAASPFERLRAIAEAQGWWNASAANGLPQEARPWPVLLLTGLGAWLATLPMVLFVGMIVSTVTPDRAVPYVGAVVSLALARMLLRAGEKSLFLEQLMVPALLTGIGCLALGLFHDLPNSLAAALICAALLGLSTVFSRTWLRILLGAGAAVAAACVPALLQGPATRMLMGFWIGWHAVALLAVAAWVLVDRIGPARQALWVEAVACGASLAAVAGLAALAGMSFLVGASTGEPLNWIPRHESSSIPLRLVSIGLALAAAGHLWWRSTVLRTPAAWGSTLALVALAGLMDMLGALLLLLAVTVQTGRLRRAAAAAFGAVWVIGAFYYALTWPLIVKAAVLAAVGAVWVLAALWLRRRTADRVTRSGTPMDTGAGPTLTRLGLALSGLAAIGLAGTSVWRNERLIAQGRPSFIELAPVDPRSLVMGDYMALAYRMPPEVARTLEQPSFDTAARVAARRDERNILSLTRLLGPGESPAAGEEAIALARQNGRWVVTSNAWFFPEGEAQRWQPARYGEFRLLPDGRALLVGLRGADLAELPPLPTTDPSGR